MKVNSFQITPRSDKFINSARFSASDGNHNEIDDHPHNAQPCPADGI